MRCPLSGRCVGLRFHGYNRGDPYRNYRERHFSARQGSARSAESQLGLGSVRLASVRDIGCTRHGVAGRSSAHPVAAARIAGQLPPRLAGGTCDRRPVAAALVVASAAPVRITLFADVSVLAEHEYREPSLDQPDRIRWFGHDIANRGNSKIMLDVPAAPADPTRTDVYGAVVVGEPVVRHRSGQHAGARRAGGCGDRARIRTTAAAALTTDGVDR